MFCTTGAICWPFACRWELRLECAGRCRGRAAGPPHWWPLVTIGQVMGRGMTAAEAEAAIPTASVLAEASAASMSNAGVSGDAILDGAPQDSHGTAPTSHSVRLLSLLPPASLLLPMSHGTTPSSIGAEMLHSCSAFSVSLSNCM